ncbi:Uncharacterised protein [Niallia circulans]|uniref:hypothetical protein n=1 Tax=Niallia circulans TaxID=1397 RepID=UPI00077CA0C1|nr:hypothetical protein [Niallia circulans]MDR4318416.1 hypothetical protein [Niallia circulans]MED3839261.1 hypothetical protein [Niallia circulans]MED4242394.1 hypothetical protein [Niallia circulans]MED4250496.1 hypothetical protein [Niallia circulans]QKH59815.1 hypothetical protein FOC77_03640 [Niallia circulans]
MAETQTDKDLETLLDGKELSAELTELKDVLVKYAQSRKVNNVKERVSLIYVVSAVLNWNEEEFYQVVNRMNRIIVKSNLGFDINQIISQIQLMNKKKRSIKLRR